MIGFTYSNWDRKGVKAFGLVFYILTITWQQSKQKAETIMNNADIHVNIDPRF